MKSINALNLVLDTLEKNLKAWQSQGYAVVPAGVAYSGGGDSGVLLWSAVRVLGPDQVVAFWVDHGVRPESERRQEALLVERNCRELGVPLKKYGPPEGVLLGQGPEDSFRRYRLDCLVRGAQEAGLCCVLTAHHADDQVETLLMRLFQGRSWDGLSGIPSVRGVFFRPFLKISRQELRQAAEEIQLDWHEDSSNAHSEFLRNTLRNEIVPQILKVFPRARDALGELGELWRRLHQTPEVPDSSWTFERHGAVLPFRVWASWPPSQKESQLLTVARRLRESSSPQFSRISRRFLENLTSKNGPETASSGAWKFQKTENEVRWRWIVEVSTLSYYVRVKLNREYKLPGYSVSFHRESLGAECFKVGVSDSKNDFVWRTLGVSEAWTLPDGTVSDKRWHRHHGGPVGLFQKGLLFAIFDPDKLRILWQFEDPGLIKEGIFVKLIPRSV